MILGSAPTSSLSRSGAAGGNRLISSTASRTFSSSRPYATVLRSETAQVTTGDAEDVPMTMVVGAGAGAGASSSPQQATVLISAPKKEELDPEEELIEDSEARFQISERAAEVCTGFL
jgi:hypothetical protein